MARLFAAVLFCLIAFPSQAQDFPIDCKIIRAFVAEHGKLKAIAYAIEHGATWQQIKEARKCLAR